MKQIFLNGMLVTLLMAVPLRSAGAEDSSIEFGDGGRNIIQMMKVDGEDVEIKIFNPNQKEYSEVKDKDPIKNLVAIREDPYAAVEGEKTGPATFLFRGVKSGKWTVQTNDIPGVLARPRQTWEPYPGHVD